MTLTAIKGDRDQINKKLLAKAYETLPSLILDCGNAADPHAIRVDEQLLHHVYVMNAEAIYRFRDALKSIPRWAAELKVKTIIITTIHILYSYDDETENFNVLENCWELMKGISNDYLVYVGIGKDKMHSVFAERFSDVLEHA